MRPTQGSSELADDTIVLILLGAGLATVAGPSLLAAAGVKVSDWLVAHHILVPADQALFPLPLIAAGPDARRLIVAALGLLALLAGWWALRRRRPVKAER